MNETAWKANPESPDYQATKEMIVQRAAEVIEDVGVDKLRLDHVAKRAGCARQTLYRYFNSKDELIQAVVIHYTLVNAQDIMQRVKRIKDPKKRLIEIIYHGAMNLKTNPKFAIFIDLRDSSYLATLSLETAPELMETIIDDIFQDAPANEILANKHLSRAEVFAWIIMQIYSLASFNMIGHNENQERNFIRTLMIPGVIEE